MNALIVIFFITYGVYALFNNFKFWVIYLALLGLYFFLTQIKFFRTAFLSVRRKIMIATWGPLNDPQIYAKVKLDITKMEPYLAEKSKEIGEKITLTVFSIKLLSIVLKKYPEIYGFIKFGKFINRDDLDICCMVDNEGQSLANLTIKNADIKNFKMICQELKESSEKLRKKSSSNEPKKTSIFKKLPTFLMGPLIQISSYLASIGISLDFLGIQKHKFGSCVLTSLGTLGVEDVFAPIPPPTFAPFLVSICKKKVKYYYDDNKQIQERITLGFNFTIDSRYIDPKDAEALNRDFKSFGENPEIFDKEMNSLQFTSSIKDKKLI